MEQTDPLALAGREFERRLVAVRPDQWQLPTPCPGWTVRDLVNHVVAADRMTPVLLAGGSVRDALAVLTADQLGDDPVSAFRAAEAEQARAFAEPGVWERTCHHPVGDIPAGQLYGFRVGDLTLHAWDLARATGTDETLDEGLAALVYEGMRVLAPGLAGTGMFGTGPSGTVADDAPVQLKLLDLSGRRP